jgi:hypothetical protein
MPKVFKAMKTPNLVKAFSVRKNCYRLVRCKGNKRTDPSERCVEITFRFYIHEKQTEHGFEATMKLCHEVQRCAEAGLADEFLPD